MIAKFDYLLKEPMSIYFIQTFEQLPVYTSGGSNSSFTHFASITADFDVSDSADMVDKCPNLNIA